MGCRRILCGGQEEQQLSHKLTFMLVCMCVYYSSCGDIHHLHSHFVGSCLPYGDEAQLFITEIFKFQGEDLD